MTRLPLRLLVALLALAGLVALGMQQQRLVRQAADRVVADAVAGYLLLVVPAARPAGGGFALEQLVSTVSRLEGAEFWHAGLHVTLRGVAIGPEEEVPARAVARPLRAPGALDTLGSVAVWDVTPRPRMPGWSWLLVAATLFVAGLGATRRVGWLWPLLGLVLAALSVRAVFAEIREAGDRGAETALAHIGPMAALALLDARLPSDNLAAMGESLRVREVADQPLPEPPGWRETGGARMAVVQMARGSGVVVEVGLAPAEARSPGFEIGVAGAVILLLLAMVPPILPRRGRRLPPAGDTATIPR